jgi:hypothetical protein
MAFSGRTTPETRLTAAMETTLSFLEQLVVRAHALASEIDYVARNWRFQNLDFAELRAGI